MQQQQQHIAPGSERDASSSATTRPGGLSMSAHEAILRHRKPRQTKACHPCRFRKLKCDFNVPCERCVSRGHPDLCNVPIAPRRKRPVVSDSGNDETAGKGHGSQSDQHSPTHDSGLDYLDDNHDYSSLDNGSSDLPPEQFPGIQDEGLCAVDDMTGGLIFLGSKSRPAFVQEYWKTDQSTSKFFRGLNLVSVFCLNNYDATYPFVNFWASNRGDFDLYNTLPSDSTCMRYYRSYRDNAYPIFPALVNVSDFESQLCDFLLSREREKVEFPQGHEEAVHGKTWAWIGLLFAVLSSGCQFSDLPLRDRELTTRVYMCCSFECLRIVNFFLRPSLETIQTLSLLANVTQNHSNPGIAWSISGMNVRLAQTIGLHLPQSLPYVNESLDLQRKQCWRMIAWQDSSISLSFDRDPISAIRQIHFNPHSSPSSPRSSEGTSYYDTMDFLCALTLEVQNRHILHVTLSKLLAIVPVYQDRLSRIFDNAADHLKDKSRCQSLKDRLEHLALKIQISYVRSELFRPFLLALKQENSRQSRSVVDEDGSHTQLALSCLSNLFTTVEASIELHRLSPIATRSWEFSYRTISSGLLLGIFGLNLDQDLGRYDNGEQNSDSISTKSITNMLHRLVSVLEHFGHWEGEIHGSERDTLNLPSQSKKAERARNKAILQEFQGPTRTANGNGVAGVGNVGGIGVENMDADDEEELPVGSSGKAVEVLRGLLAEMARG